MLHKNLCGRVHAALKLDLTIDLRPENWDSPSDLSVGVEVNTLLKLLIVEPSLNHDLFRLNSIRGVSIIIDTSGIVPCATHQPAPP